MLLAYLDEIGETGAFVSRDHPRYNTSPVFGYGGFIIPGENARDFSAHVTRVKQQLFATELAQETEPGKWERKGANMFRPHTDEAFPQYVRAFNGLVSHLRRLGGLLFYYGDEKPLGTPGQTKLNTSARESIAMRESLNRVATHAELREQPIMVLMDQITEKTRAERLPTMYGHIFARAAEHQEMRRIVEPPMHVDSVLSANIQFADWVAALVSRAVDFQLFEASRYGWVARTRRLNAVRGGFTNESKIHLCRRSVSDLPHSDILSQQRRLFPTTDGYRVGASIDPAIVAKLRGKVQPSVARKATESPN